MTIFVSSCRNKLTKKYAKKNGTPCIFECQVKTKFVQKQYKKFKNGHFSSVCLVNSFIISTSEGRFLLIQFNKARLAKLIP